VIGRRTSRHFNFSFHELCEVDFGLLHKELNIRQSENLENENNYIVEHYCQE